MIYSLGFLAFFQITYLPGFLFLHFLRIKTKTLTEKIIFIFGLSLIINFVLVFLLTLLRLYQPITVYIIFTLEIIMFLLTIVSKRLIIRLTLSLILMISLLVIIRFIVPFLQNFSFKSVFLEGDAIDSWNVWAVQWANNKIPLNSNHYPQLIPANWSLTYVFMKTTKVELFAKLLMPLFTLGILFIFFDLENFIGLIITGVLFHYYFDNSFLRDGYVDIAFAFFAFLPFYCWQLYQKYKQKQYLFLMIIFALGSFLTKQLGFYIVFLASIPPTRWFLAKSNNLNKLKKPLFLFSFFLLTITISWYILKFPEIKTSYNIESIYHAAMTNKLTQFSISSRFLRSINLLTPNIKGVFIVSIVTLLTLLSLKNKQSRQLLGFIVLPLFIFWSMFLNYDQRNLCVIFPYLGYISSTCCKNLLYYNVLKHCNKTFIFNSLLVFVVLIVSVFLANLFISNSKLLYSQTEGKKQIGIPELNSRLYDYYYKQGFSGKISTSYYQLCNLPEIGKYCLYSPTTIPTAKYYLYPKERLKNLKSYQIIFHFQNWIFVEAK